MIYICAKNNVTQTSLHSYTPTNLQLLRREKRKKRRRNYELPSGSLFIPFVSVPRIFLSCISRVEHHRHCRFDSIVYSPRPLVLHKYSPNLSFSVTQTRKRTRICQVYDSSLESAAIAMVHYCTYLAKVFPLFLRLDCGAWMFQKNKFRERQTNRGARGKDRIPAPTHSEILESVRIRQQKQRNQTLLWLFRIATRHFCVCCILLFSVRCELSLAGFFMATWQWEYIQCDV